MRTLGCLVLFIAATMVAGNKPHYDLNDGPALFQKFMKDYNRHYKDEADKEAHYQAFLKTLQVINKSNTPEGTATFDINMFADYTPEETKNMRGLKIIPNEK